MFIFVAAKYFDDMLNVSISVTGQEGSDPNVT